jgi:hypothetical protein
MTMSAMLSLQTSTACSLSLQPQCDAKTAAPPIADSDRMTEVDQRISCSPVGLAILGDAQDGIEEQSGLRLNAASC